MQRTNMEVIEFQGKVNKLTRAHSYHLNKAREANNVALKMSQRGIGAASFHALKATDLFKKADDLAEQLERIQHTFNNPDFWTRAKRFLFNK